MSTLTLQVNGAELEGKWEIHVRDARLALGLDTGVADEEGWRDLQAHEGELRALLATRLKLLSNDQPCPWEFTPAPMKWDAKFKNVGLQFHSVCPVVPTRLGIRNDLLFDKDPMHRAYFSIEDERATNLGVLHADNRSITVDVKQFHLGEVIVEFTREGTHHIWSGIDHILFLLALLLPAGLLRTGREWSPRPGFWRTAREVAKVVTAFTLAHSVTLALSYFGVVTPGSRLVETAIAFSVFAAAWNNVHPFLPGRAWTMAAGFGLVHGLGFAGALKNLSLPRHARGLTLGAFNLGVELGQLAIVIPVLPVLFLLSRRRPYPRLIMGLGSLLIAWVAMLWVLQRGFGVELFTR